MSNEEAKIKTKFRVENITPILNVKDISASMNFYVNMLGFTNADWGDENFTCVSRDGSSIYLCRNGQGHPGTWIWVGFDGNIFDLYSEFKSRGVLIQQPPVSHPWAMEMLVQDPDGHVLRFGTDPENNTNK
jgi:predicted lactoylglutathione lyase